MSFFNQQTIPPPSSKPDEIKRSVNALNIRISNLERRPLPIGNSSYPLLQQMGNIPTTSNGTTVQNIIGKHFNVNQFINNVNSGSGAGGVLSITGTANQITASSPTGNVTLSIPTPLIVATIKATTIFQIGYAVDALGVGAPATLGLTGGTGPATATQNAWMKVNDSTGTPFWVPIWV